MTGLGFASREGLPDTTETIEDVCFAWPVLCVILAKERTLARVGETLQGKSKLRHNAGAKGSLLVVSDRVFQCCCLQLGQRPHASTPEQRVEP